MATVYRIKRFAQFNYDETDALKRMKDSEILSEQQKQKPGYGGVARAVGSAAIAGGAAGLALGAGSHIFKNRKAGVDAMANGLGKKMGKWGKWGAIGAAAVAGANALSKRSEEVENVNKYNNRLNYAQRKAASRERADWKANMTQRDGYSY